MHESERVLGDRLVNEADTAKFREFRDAVIKKQFADLPLVGHCPCLLLGTCLPVQVATRI